MLENNIYFLICSERSGSNFITKIFDNHPNVCGPSPVHMLRIFSQFESKYGNLNKNENWDKFVYDIIHFFNLKISHWDTQIERRELLELAKRSLSEIFKYIYFKEASLHGKTSIFVKENHAHRLIPYYLLNFPESKFVWSVRDPRDMALSWKNDAILRGGIVRSATIWKEDQKASNFIYNTILDNNKMCLVKYEDLTTNTEIEVRRMCDFMGLNFDFSMLNFGASENSKKNANASPSWANLNKDIMKNNSRKFLTGLSKVEIQFIEYLCKEEMSILGYLPEFPLLSREEFFQIQHELLLEEKFEKESYKSVSELEKEKRNTWMLWVNQLNEKLK